MANGKLIVIEGADGCGKKTQTEILTRRLQETRVVTSLSFPQYGKKSAGLVEEYLAGRYGHPSLVSPFAASLFYAVDRFDVARELRAALERGDTVVLDRYVDSNAGHQGGKISDPKERAGFITWLYGMEYGILGVPRPDLVVVLHVPVEITIELMKKRGGKADGHEADIRHLKNAEASYLWLAEQYPDDHKVVECAEGGNILPPEVIAEKVYALVEPFVS